MGAGVLLTRLLPPRLPPSCVPRERLIDGLLTGLDGRLVTVLAGAGYGKSTLVAQALDRSPLPSIWVSCDARLGGAPDLLAHVAAGVERLIPGFGSRLTFEGSTGRQVAMVCNEFAVTAPDDVVLAFDDVHLLDESATAALAELVRDLPPTVRIVLAGRSPLGFALGKLRAGHHTAFRATDLALTPEEMSAIWASAGGPCTHSADLLARIRERTEGWVTGVILTARTGDVELARLTGDELFAYLAEEVLLGQPREIQDFALQTAVLERFSPELASMLTGRVDAQFVCRSLLDRNLFTVRLEAQGEWYRYHHLFREFLLDRVAQLEPSLIHELHRRAADALIAAGQAPEAVDHLLSAHEFERAADLVESVADAMRLSPQTGVLARWIDALPEELHAGRPSLRLAHAITTFARSEPEAGFALLDLVLDDLIATGDHDRAASAFFTLIYMQLAFGTRQRFALDVGLRQLPRIAESAPLLPASMMLMAAELGCAARYEEADAMLDRILKLSVPAIDPLGQGYLASTRALFLDHPRGRSKQALATMDWVIALFERNARYDQLGFIVALHAYRGILLNHLGRYDETLIELDRMGSTAVARGMADGASRAITKLRAVALAGLERWDELEVLLGLAEPIEQMRGASYGVRLTAPSARLAAHRGDAAAVAHHATAVLDYVEAFGFSFDTPGWICDVAVAAWQVGLTTEACRLRDEVLAGAELAESPWTRARGQLLGAALVDGVERDEVLTEALELTGEWGFAEIWTRRDRVLAATTLARAIESELGPAGLASRLAAQAGGEVLGHCTEKLAHAPEPARQRLLDALDEFGINDSEIRRRLAGRRSGPVPAAGRASGRPPLRIQALGGFAVRRGGESIPVSAFGRERARKLLGALVCADGPVHRERLIDWLWPDLDAERGLRALHVTIHSLRRALEPELGRGGARRSVIRAEGESYRLVLAEGDSVDVADFLANAESVRGRDAAVAELADAERLYGGPLYPEWPYADWAEAHRRLVEQAWSALLSGLGDQLAATGDHHGAVLRYERLVALEPERETAHRNLMLSYARAGEKALALRQYHACRAVMRRELGIEPSVETRRLYQLILVDDLPTAAGDAAPDPAIGIVVSRP